MSELRGRGFILVDSPNVLKCVLLCLQELGEASACQTKASPVVQAGGGAWTD